MENNIGYIFTLLLGLFSIIKYKDLSKFMNSQAKGIPFLIPKKWDILFMQVMILIVGSIFFIVSLLKLIQIYIN